MIASIIKKHENYRLSSLNLIASENRISADALNALASDLAGRYGDKWYGGSLHANEIFLEVERLAKKLFHAKYAFITPISGNICDLAVLFSFTKCGDKVAGIPKEEGGYPFGYEKFEREFISLPARNYEIKVKEALDVIEKEKPLLTLLGASVFPFPHPVKELKKAREYGTLAYDASHVLGLIAGGKFQQPLKEGADVMIGSTHKSFPGPQGGVVVTNSEEKAESLEKMLCFSFEEGIGLVDNPHPNRIAALGIVLEEMLFNGKKYASQVIKNAKSFASRLYENNIPVKFAQKGFTESHQILLDIKDSQSFCRMLEKQNIFIDISGRIGVAEVTHIGMKEREMEEIADLIKDAYEGKNVKERVKELVKEFY